jgi:hypothetical protein
VASNINKAARTKVDLKTNLSRPLLANEEDAPQLRPKPVPLDWMRIAPTKRSETIICTTIKNSLTAYYTSGAI